MSSGSPAPRLTPGAPRVLSINVGLPQAVAWGGVSERTAIVKAPAAGPVAVRGDGLVGDEQEDQRNHGGPYHAVYAYAREDYDAWEDRLARPLPQGMFGENLTTTGLDLTGTVLGTRWQLGSALLEVCGPRIPCQTFARRMGERRWVKRFTEVGASGCYLRVLEPGTIRSGDPIVVLAPVESSPVPVTVGTCFRALTTEPDLLGLLVDVPALPSEVRAQAARRAADAGGPRV